MPVVHTAGAPAIPEPWTRTDFVQPDAPLLVLPLWSSQAGIGTGDGGRGPRTSPGRPFVVAGSEFRSVPERLGARLNSYVVGPGWAAGRKTELRALYLLSGGGQVTVMVAADVADAGPAWIAVLTARMSPGWKLELVQALDRGLVPFHSAGADSLWGPRYTVSPPPGVPEFVVQAYNRPHRLEYFDMPFALAAEDERTLRQFLDAIPEDRLGQGQTTWQQVFKR